MSLNSVNFICNIFVLVIRNVTWGPRSSYLKVHKIRYKHTYSVFTNGLISLLVITLSAGTVLGDSLTEVIPVGEFPQALEFDPSNNNIA